MIFLTTDEILLLHQKLLAATGGLDGVRDPGLLESAVYSAMQAFAEEEVYATVEEKAARLAYAITQNHPFCDGNKRIGVLVMLMTLRLNGIGIVYTQKELIDLGLSIANGSRGYEAILAWIRAHRRP